MNNFRHSDERVHVVPINESPNPYQNHNLNAIVWLHPLERQQRDKREATYNKLKAENDKLYELLLLAKLQAVRKWNKRKNL